MSYSGEMRYIARSNFLCVCNSTNVRGSSKIEYMVVSFDDQDKNAKLSLRQTEILAKLQSIVSDIVSDRGEA